MDMIEYAIWCLREQIRGIADVVPNPEAVNKLLDEAAELLDRASGLRHDARSGLPSEAVRKEMAAPRSSETKPDEEYRRHGAVAWFEAPFDDTPEAQRALLDRVEDQISPPNLPRIRINSGAQAAASDKEL